MLEYTLATKIAPDFAEFSKQVHVRASGTINADVGVWVGGSLRASMIISGKEVTRAVFEAAIRAASDMRFMPLEVEDLANARIELTLWSTLEIPLLPLEIAHGELYYTKTSKMSSCGSSTLSRQTTQPTPSGARPYLWPDVLIDFTRLTRKSHSSSC